MTHVAMVTASLWHCNKTGKGRRKRGQTTCCDAAISGEELVRPAFGRLDTRRESDLSSKFSLLVTYMETHGEIRSLHLTHQPEY